ncbi:uncharacterized protein LOC142322659 [Lycorma delicatula]|uniref:uncharacterized protein LOC142322659 n=1 Tax=Lycorma delicatula TaxID=130591 RepID=UPI003F516241
MKHVNKNSQIKSLNPFVNNQQLLRVGGRISNSNLCYEQKHPILLPAKGRLTKLIVEQKHINQLHAGPQLLACIRKKFWPLNGCNVVCKIVQSCVKCFRANPQATIPLMGDLLSSRLNPRRPFNTCGVDFCGPIHARASQRCGIKPNKGYIVVFVCFSMKAVYLKVVGDLTTKAFLGTCIKALHLALMEM